VDCHDPHTGVIQLRKAGQQTTRTTCENCHYQEARFQKNPDHMKPTANVTCISCHMPHLAKSALGDLERFTGDIRSHLFAIDPYQQGQFTEDGKYTLSQISLDYACRSCHIPGSDAALTDEELFNMAVNYHQRIEQLPTEGGSEETP